MMATQRPSKTDATAMTAQRRLVVLTQTQGELGVIAAERSLWTVAHGVSSGTKNQRAAAALASPCQAQGARARLTKSPSFDFRHAARDGGASAAASVSVV